MDNGGLFVPEFGNELLCSDHGIAGHLPREAKWQFAAFDLHQREESWDKVCELAKAGILDRVRALAEDDTDFIDKFISDGYGFSEKTRELAENRWQTLNDELTDLRKRDLKLGEDSLCDAIQYSIMVMSTMLGGR